jgi:hypothetical protein
MAKAVAADPNAVLEVQGFTDPRGSDRYNDELSRARVEAVVRHLVQRHGIELRQLYSASMGRVTFGPEKPSGDAFANARRVDIRLLAPWSSWEDSAQADDLSTAAGAASPPTTGPRPSATRPAPPRQSEDGNEPNRNAGALTLREILRTISKEDLGGRD